MKGNGTRGPVSSPNRPHPGLSLYCAGICLALAMSDMETKITDWGINNKLACRNLKMIP